MIAHHHDPGSTPGLWAVWLVISVLIALYLRAAFQRGCWSAMRSTSFATGGALLLLAFSEPVVQWAHSDLRGHMVQHLLLGMFGPFFLVMGAPVTLLLGSVSARWARRSVRFLGSAPVRFVAHPVSALILNVGGMAVLYATPLYALSRNHAGLHVLVHYHFVAAGYLFAWSITGPDPAPHRPSLRTRLIVLFAGIATHATLSKLMYIHGWPAGTGASAEEIRIAAQWMYYGGDVAEMLLVAALLAAWMRQSLKRLQTGAPPEGMAMR